MPKEKKLKVPEMREILVKDGGYEEKDVSTLNKKQLKELVDSIQSVQDILTNAEVQKDETEKLVNSLQNSNQEELTEELNKETDDMETSEEETEENTPCPTNSNWTDYVLTLFSKEEMDNGSPRVDGLRRVTELLYGPFNIKTFVIESPRIDNAGRATVMVSIQFLKEELVGWSVDGAADVFSGNTDKKFAKHAVATAETRAEGRALRKALKLTKVLSAEETYNSDDNEADGSDGRIVQSMVSSLNLMATRAGVDPVKAAIKMDFDIQNIDELTQKQALKLADKIGKYQRKDEEIPDEIKSL